MVVTLLLNQFSQLSQLGQPSPQLSQWLLALTVPQVLVVVCLRLSQEQQLQQLLSERSLPRHESLNPVHHHLAAMDHQPGL